MRPANYRSLVTITAILAFVVVVVGAFVRLSDAGLGCPDWPGCYGKPAPTLAKAAIERAVARQGGDQGPVSLGKAWKEMGHRYLAGTLGVLILVIALVGWVRRRTLGQSPWLASVLVLVVALQAALGMWTVTLRLKPVIVTAHLIGGMTTFALLVWLALRQWKFSPESQAYRLRVPAAIALLVVVVQIMLGGWVSANYAALACPDWPLCLGHIVPKMDFANAFHLIRPLGRTGSGAMLPFDALTAIHWTHRTFALVVVLVVGWTAWATLRIPALRPVGWLLVALLIIQFSLGVTNVLAGLPLAVADAHNAGAALLLGALVMLNFFAFHGLRPGSRKA